MKNLFFAFFSLAVIDVYSQDATVKKFQDYTKVFEKLLPQGLEYGVINSKYINEYKNAKDTVGLYNSKLAEISAYRATAYSKAQFAKSEGLKELGKVTAKKNVVSDQELLDILSSQYQKYIPGLRKDYLIFVKSKAGI